MGCLTRFVKIFEHKISSDVFGSRRGTWGSPAASPNHLPQKKNKLSCWSAQEQTANLYSEYLSKSVNTLGQIMFGLTFFASISTYFSLSNMNDLFLLSIVFQPLQAIRILSANCFFPLYVPIVCSSSLNAYEINQIRGNMAAMWSL